MPQGVKKKGGQNPNKAKKAAKQLSKAPKREGRKGKPAKRNVKSVKDLAKKRLDSKLRIMTEDAFIRKATQHVSLGLVKSSGALDKMAKLQKKGTIRPRKAFLAEQKRIKENEEAKKMAASSTKNNPFF